MIRFTKRLKRAFLSRFWAFYEKLMPRTNNSLYQRPCDAGQFCRCLEIGPGDDRIEGFETLNINPGPNVDYVGDATRRLPFEDNTFDLVYCSHILEHVPWYQTEATLMEWIRVLRPGGRLEVWVPDGLKICKAFVDNELYGVNYINKDGWYKFNEKKDPNIWASGRIFSYGDGNGNPNSPNWHRAIFSRTYLVRLFENAGLKEIRDLKSGEVRGHDHGWINLGITGVKDA